MTPTARVVGRRRFIAITAGAGLGALTGALPARATPRLYRWRGTALGAAASITIAHDNAAQLTAQAQAEISRLEAVFSLYRADSALSRLNAAGRLAAPPFELVELLSICDGVHARTDGVFDPTVQPLWALYAERYATRGVAPTDHDIDATLARTGWHQVDHSQDAVSFRTAGMALTLNGIAQGYIADKVAALLRNAGVRNVLVNMGEIAAVGRQPHGTPWRVGIADPTDPTRSRKHRDLVDRAIATSAPLGTAYDPAVTVGHILDPRTGRPGGKWRQVSVIAATATQADGLSTAFCLMDAPAIRQASADVEVDLLS